MFSSDKHCFYILFLIKLHIRSVKPADTGVYWRSMYLQIHILRFIFGTQAVRILQELRLLSDVIRGFFTTLTPIPPSREYLITR
jgi:hypothetical protein